MKKLLPLAAVAVIAAAGAWWFMDGTTPPSGGLGAVSAQGAAEVDTSMVQEMTIGAEDAPVEIVEYASFTCPHCKAFHDQSWAKLKADYIDTGKVKFTYREVYFDRFGLWAAMIARCGGADRYFGVVDLIFDTQGTWIGDGDPAKIADNLRRLGRTAGMSDEQINACMNDQAKAQALVAVYQKNATEDDVTSTPTFFINGTKHSNMSYAEMAKLIDAELPEG